MNSHFEIAFCKNCTEGLKACGVMHQGNGTPQGIRNVASQQMPAVCFRRLKHMHVLVVEDDAALGLFLQKGLKLEGHEVSWVGDGEAALEHVQQNRPDLVVLDLSLQWSCPVLGT